MNRFIMAVAASFIATGMSQAEVTEDDLKNEVAMPASPGDLLAHHALTIHRADGNASQSRTRQALGFIFYSVDAKDDVAALESHRHQLASQQQGKI